MDQPVLFCNSQWQNSLFYIIRVGKCMPFFMPILQHVRFTFYASYCVLVLVRNKWEGLLIHGVTTRDPPSSVTG